MKRSLIIIGAGSVGGHIAYNLNSYNLEEYNLLGFLDDDPNKVNKEFCGYPILGNVDHITFLAKDVAVIIGIAFPFMKQDIIARLSKLGKFEYPYLIAKTAWISKAITIQEGVIIYPGCSINYGTSIDSFVVMNMNCAIGHDCSIGAYSSLAPGVNLAGHTSLGIGVDMGISSSTKQGVCIGNNSIVGGQSMLINDIPESVVVAGVPAKRIKANHHL